MICCFALVVLSMSFDASALNRTRDCSCRVNVNNRIVGGSVAAGDNYPWQASLGLSKIPKESTYSSWSEWSKLVSSILNRIFDLGTFDLPPEPLNSTTKLGIHMCGAFILNENWILTAAHCVLDYSSYQLKAKDPKELSIGIGHNHDLIQMFDQGRILAKKIIVKPRYTPRIASSPNDLALIQLEHPLQLNGSVAAACLQSQDYYPYPQKLVATGWGSINRMEVNALTGHWSGYEASRYLKEADFEDSSRSASSCLFRKDLICISPTPGEEKSSCKGDSGGPLHFTHNGRTYVVGATSFGPSRMKEMFKYETCIGTAAYTRLSYHMDWIKENAGDICDF